MTTDDVTRVAGESVRDLWQILSRMELDPEDNDGMACLRATAPRELFPPLQRALMRMEAEELLAEADTITAFDSEPRTPDQRRADALSALIQRFLQVVLSNRASSPSSSPDLA
jgi:hypothetical protein